MILTQLDSPVKDVGFGTLTFTLLPVSAIVQDASRALGLG